MPSPSSADIGGITSDESRKETGEEVLTGVEAQECATKKKRIQLSVSSVAAMMHLAHFRQLMIPS